MLPAGGERRTCDGGSSARARRVTNPRRRRPGGADLAEAGVDGRIRGPGGARWRIRARSGGERPRGTRRRPAADPRQGGRRAPARKPGGARRRIRARAGRRGGEAETTGEIHHDMLLTLDDDAHRGARIRWRGPRRRSSSPGARGLQRKRRRREAGEERNLGD